MKDVDRGSLTVSATLAGIAGFVDAIGFLDTGGLFVSFMSGNSTQAAVEVLGPGAAVALASAGIIAAFVAGVALGGVANTRMARPRPWIVGAAALTVGAAAGLALAGEATLWRVGLLAAAMGALNTLFLADGRARVAITYSTGTLVSLGLALAALVTGGSRTAWQRPLVLWGSLVGGAVVGAVAHQAGSPLALTIAAAALAVCVVPLARSGR
ncbi:YoaK family protein [Microbacterium proteolyticum]|uniref:YoaK family protein n=1 Tax=Microbacterium proteolyticum TaxID=1572644 RepID=UPI0035C111AF